MVGTLFVLGLVFSGGPEPQAALWQSGAQGPGAAPAPLSDFEAEKRFGLGEVWLRNAPAGPACRAGFGAWRGAFGSWSGPRSRPIVRQDRALPDQAYLGIDAKLMTCGPYSVGWDE